MTPFRKGSSRLMPSDASAAYVLVFSGKEESNIDRVAEMGAGATGC
jgi:hypothetical protein